MNADRIRHNLETVQSRIADGGRRSGRPAEAVRLVAVTKKSPPEWIRALVAVGPATWAKTIPQELWCKADALADLEDSVRWHLIGHLQTNKVKKTLPMVRHDPFCRFAQTLASPRRGRANDARQPSRVCLQVNTSDEPSKHGWTPEQIVDDAESIAACRAIPIVGLMTMAALGTHAETARASFVAAPRVARSPCGSETGLPLTELSMGMSNDFETAIEEGATLVRVGSALFEGVEP